VSATPEPAAADGGRQIGAHLLGVEVTWRYRLEWFLVRLLVGVLFRVRADGLERWPPAPFQLATNHHSGWDPLLVMAISPLRPRVTWFGPKEVDFSKGFKNRVMGFFGGMIPFNPAKTNLGSSVRAVQRVFDAGGVLAIAAEGTLGFRESELLPLQGGATVFAALSGVPVVPCAIVGSSTLWWRKEVVIRFGAPIPVDREADREARDAIAEGVRAGITALLPHDEPAYPARRPGCVFLTDVFNGPGERRRWRTHMAEVGQPIAD
jgi:1-acyl-sn-glycerol-3-phosphate acyltransferase